jgi:hypothetical protein
LPLAVGTERSNDGHEHRDEHRQGLRDRGAGWLQPRRQFDEAVLEQLAASIKKNGITRALNVFFGDAGSKSTS